jgi:hypothetical protein
MPVMQFKQGLKITIPPRNIASPALYEKLQTNGSLSMDMYVIMINMLLEDLPKSPAKGLMNY